MLASNQIIYLSFLGAALFLLLPVFFFIDAPNYQKFIAIGFQFLTGWILLAITMYLHSRLISSYENGIPILGWSLLLLFGVIALDVLLTTAFMHLVANPFRPPIPLIPESTFQNTVLSVLSLTFVFQYVQRKKNEANKLRIVQLQKENLQLQLNSLQQQLNPHFFFNSLNTLSELIYIDIEKSEEYINKLSQVFRYILDRQEQPLIPLKEELEFIQSYFYLLKIRFEDKLNLSCQIEQHESYHIPSLSLLVLFENVIKHNAISEHKPMHIQLHLTATHLSVENNKNPLHELRHPSLGIGLENLNNRCVLLTNHPCIIEDEAHSFTVKIPVVKHHEDHNN